MKVIVIHDGAHAELDEAIAFYESEQAGLGMALLLEVERATKIIQKHPQIGSPYKSTAFRRYVLGQFPYIIFYLELTELIWVAAIAHSSRKPDYWKDRSENLLRSGAGQI